MCLLSHHLFICATKLWWKRAPEGGFVNRSAFCSLWWIGVIELLSLWRLASSSSFYPVQKTACGSRAFGLGMSRGRCIRQKNRRNTSISGQTCLLKLWLGARRSCGTGSLIGAHSWGQGHVRSRHIPGRRQCVLLIFRKFCHSLFTFISLHKPDLYTHNCLYYILCFCYFVHCLFVYYSFIICVLSCCCHSVAPWSFCYYNKLLVCVNVMDVCQ